MFHASYCKLQGIFFDHTTLFPKSKGKDDLSDVIMHKTEGWGQVVVVVVGV